MSRTAHRTAQPFLSTLVLLFVVAVALSVATPALAAPQPEPQGSHERYDRDHDRGRDHRHDRGHHDRRRSDRSDHRYDHHRYDRHRYDHRYDHRHDYRYDRGYQSRRHTFTIPSRIRDFDAYRNYYHGRVYDRGHHHYHLIYSFPVYLDGRVVYEPFAYCEGNYFGRGDFFYDGPRLSIHWRF